MYKKKIKENSKSYSFTKFASSNTKLDIEKTEDQEQMLKNNFIKIDESFKQNKTCLRSIYPRSSAKSNYGHIFILQQISDIFIYLTLDSGLKTMSHSCFRLFIK